MVDEAVRKGAQFILTPEVTNCISVSRVHQEAVLTKPEQDQTLAALRAKAREAQVWILIGSLALKTDDLDGRFANRSFLIDPRGQIAATYDKIHMFDVTVSPQETYHESKGYRAGTQAVVAQMDGVGLGMTVCYDLRFPHLFRALAQAGAALITVPSAFSSVTGAAHWESLLRARAIETGCFIIAPAQTGDHGGRTTYGHSMVVDPWGKVVVDAGVAPGVCVVEIDPEEVSKVRAQIPAWSTNAFFESPK